MKKISCCFIILLCSFYTYAQSNKKLDSLKKVLAKLPKEGASFAGDTMRVRLLCETSFHKAFTKPEISISWSLEALKISEKIKWQKGIAGANHQIGYSNIMFGKPFNAISYLFKSLKDAEELKLDSLIGVNYRQLGNIYYNLGRYSISEKYYTLALPFFDKIKYYRGFANCLNDIGRGYFQRKLFEKAIYSFKKCISYSKKNKLPIIENYCTWSLVDTYIEQKKYNDALEFAKKGLELNKVNEEVIPYDWMIANNNFAKIYLGMNKLKKALKYAKEAERYIPKMQDSNGWYVYLTLFNIYKTLGDSKHALENYEKYISLKERIKEQDFEKQIKNVEYEYQNEKQKIHIKLLNKNLEQENLVKKVLIGGITTFMLFVSFLWYNNQLLEKKNKKIEEQKNEILLVKDKLEDLNNSLELKVKDRTSELLQANKELIRKNQEITEALYKGQTIERKRVAVELHDNLGSMLSSMKWRLQALNKDNLSEKEQKIYESILAMMGDAYSEVRLISHNLLPAELEEKGLFGALEKLINDINQSGKLRIRLNTGTDMLIRDNKIALELYSICMEMVNNILKHSEATEASINFLQLREYLILQIHDNGKGMESSQNSGFGLRNIRNRVDNLGGEIKIDINNGTHIEFCFHNDL